jgi:hypothetical protein
LKQGPAVKTATNKPGPPRKASNIDTDPSRVFFPRLSRLAFLLEQIAKPPDERSPEMDGIIGRNTKFDMGVVSVGKRIYSVRIVERVDFVGLAACDPWFNDQGLSLSVIRYPGQDDALDICGVILRNDRSGKKHHVSWLGAQLPAFFGLADRPKDWEELADMEWYWEKAKARIPVTPEMVLKKLDECVQLGFGCTLEDIRSRAQVEAVERLEAAE